MARKQAEMHPKKDIDDLRQQTGLDAEIAERVIRDLKAASGLVENSAFDLAGHVNGDTVSDLIRVVADLQLLITQLSSRRS